MTMTDNPLLDFSSLPRFEEIAPKHVEPALDEILTRCREGVKLLVADSAEPTWHSFVMPLEELEDQLERMWAPVSHLNSVKDSEALRKAYEAALPKLSEYASEMGQHKGLYARVKKLKKSQAYADFSDAQKKAIENSLRDFRLAGVELDAQKQKRYQQITAQLAQLSNQFSQNVLDATDAWSFYTDNVEELAGLPESAMQMAKQLAQEAGKTGWMLNLQAPSYIAVMTYADNAQLRERMYRAYVTRASDQGPHAGKWDNSDIIEQILALRTELAQLFECSDYAQYSLQTKMATSAQQIETFLMDLAQKATPFAEKEVAQLQQFAAQNHAIENMQPWDYAYISEKLKQAQYDIDDEQLRAYFPLPKVFSGMFAIVAKLFGIEVRQAQAPQCWHEDVQYFEVRDDSGNVCGSFYADLYARTGKRGGAWMADAVGRRALSEGVQKPVAFLTCNFSAPVGEQHSLLTHDEVVTLFHEFGHTLHHLLTKIDVSAVAGINGVPWDAVELPSQFLENWCWDRQAIGLISSNVDTGQSVPDALLDKMLAARNFQSAMQMLRQIEFSLFDLRIHDSYRLEGAMSVQQVLDEVRQQVAVIKVPAFNRFAHGFSHIFAGGYAAGYYSYKWAEVLSADAYSLFEEKGSFDEQTGRAFLQHILQRGGSEDPTELFTRFRGRQPKVDALLRHSGLAA